MSDNTTDTSTANTSDATAQNTDAANSGAATDTAQQTQVTQNIAETPEFKAALTAAIKEKIPQLKRQIGRELSGEKEGGPTIEDLQRQLSERDTKLRSYEAKGKISDFIADGRNKLTVKPENVRGIEAIVLPLLEYDEDGRPSNMKEAFETAKIIAPVLFANHPSNINANNSSAPVVTTNMNDLIRRSAGYGN